MKSFSYGLHPTSDGKWMCKLYIHHLIHKAQMARQGSRKLVIFRTGVHRLVFQYPIYPFWCQKAVSCLQQKYFLSAGSLTSNFLVEVNELLRQMLILLLHPVLTVCYFLKIYVFQPDFKMKEVHLMHIFYGCSDLSYNPSYIFFQHWAILFQFGCQILMHARFIENIKEMIIIQTMIKLDNIRMIEIALHFYFSDQFGYIVGTEKLFLEHF